MGSIKCAGGLCWLGRLCLRVLLGFLGSCLLLLGSAQLSCAQTFAEWFSQKKTQIKYLTQQIAALEQYENYIKQGYSISKYGLGNIGSNLKGEFGTHSAYYNSLSAVNPSVKGGAKADSMLSYAKQIPVLFDRVSALDDLDAGSRDYIGKVETKVLSECAKDLAEMQVVLTDGKVQLTDDERIKRLDAIYGRMKDKYVFTRSFCNDVRMLLLQRDRELQDIQTVGRDNENE